MAWFTEPNKPEEPKEPVVSATDIEEPVELTEEGKRKAWRMLSLIDAFRKVNVDPLNFEEIDQLGIVAAGWYDLHDACAALRNGCTLDLLVAIYT